MLLFTFHGMLRQYSAGPGIDRPDQTSRVRSTWSESTTSSDINNKKNRARAKVRREHVELNEGVRVVKVSTHPTIKKCTRHKQIKHYRACPESANELRRMSGWFSRLWCGHSGVEVRTCLAQGLLCSTVAFVREICNTHNKSTLFLMSERSLQKADHGVWMGSMVKRLMSET